MAAQRKYPDELRERVVKMVFEVRERDGKGHGRSPGSLGCSAFTGGAADLDPASGNRRRDAPGLHDRDKQRIAELEREVRELRRAPVRY